VDGAVSLSSRGLTGRERCPQKLWSSAQELVAAAVELISDIEYARSAEQVLLLSRGDPRLRAMLVRQQLEREALSVL